MLKSKQKEIALERIKKLFKEAKLAFKRDPKLSNRYVALARKISMKTKTRIPGNFKKQFCKHCYTFLKPGENCRIRTKDKKLIYYCKNCKKYMRFPLNLKKK